MKTIDINFLVKDYINLEGNEEEYYANSIKTFLEYLKTEENHFNHDNDELSPEVYIEVDDFLENEDLKTVIIALSDLFNQVGNKYSNKLDKEEVLEEIKSQLTENKNKFLQDPNKNEHIKLMWEKIALNIQKRIINAVTTINFEPHTIIFVSTNTFNFLIENFAKKNYYNNKSHAKNPKYPTSEEILSNWDLKKIGLVQFISKNDLQNDFIISNENSRGIIITDCLNWNTGVSKLVSLKNKSKVLILKQIKNFCFIKKESPKINQSFLQGAKDRNDINCISIINIQCKSQRETLNSSIKRIQKMQGFIKKRNSKNPITNVVLSNTTLSSAFPTILIMEGNANIWNEFYQKCIDYEIPYLISIQFRNLLNSCFTEEIGKEIINAIMSPDSIIKLPDSFIEQWKGLNSTAKEEILNYLNELLNDIIGIHGRVNYSFEKFTRVILPRLVQGNEKLIEKISHFLKIHKEQIINWSSINSRNRIVSFDYRDIGLPNYPIKPPNIFEPNHLKISEVYLVSYLFEKKFYYGQYNFNNIIVKELDNKFRRSVNDWEKLINKVQEIQPKSIDKTDYELEETVQREIDLDQFEIEFEFNGRSKTLTFDEYSKFIFKDSFGFQIEDIDEISDRKNLEVLPLDELLKDLDMPEFNLENDEVIKKSTELNKKYLKVELLNIKSRVWKILLKEKVKKIGEQPIYDELKEKFKQHGFDIVSFNTFQNAWINFDSESNRTSYKHLKVLCDYLGLENDYFRFLQVFCKTEANKTRQSTIFHTELITEIILPVVEKEEFDEFSITESQKDSLILMGIAEWEIQKKLTDYLIKTKKIIVEKTKKVKKITKI